MKQRRHLVKGDKAVAFESARHTRVRAQLYLPRLEDGRKDLSNVARTVMVKKSRWALANSSIYAQCINDISIVTIGDGLKPQSLASSAENGDLYEAYFNRWSRNCDISGRFSFGDIQRIAFESMLIDGDCFVIRTEKAGLQKLQLVEAHRIGPTHTPEDGKMCFDGVFVDSSGSITGYNTYVEDGKNFTVSADFVSHICEFQRASSVRGMPLMQASLNSVQDQLEIFELEKRAVRDAADVTSILKKVGGVVNDDDLAAIISGQPSNTDDADAKKVAQAIGGKSLVLDIGEDFQQVESKRPSPAWLGMMRAIEKDICRVMPFEFVSDPNGLTGPAIRLVAGKVSRVAIKYQNTIMGRLCDQVWDWVIAGGIASGELPEDEHFTRKTWVVPPSVGIDAGREAAQDREDLKLGLTTAADILSKKGLTFDEVIRQRGKEMRAIIDTANTLNIPLPLLYSFLGLQLPLPPPETDEND